MGTGTQPAPMPAAARRPFQVWRYRFYTTMNIP